VNLVLFDKYNNKIDMKIILTLAADMTEALRYTGSNLLFD